MIVRALDSSLAISAIAVTHVLAWLSFVEHGMVLLFLPSMAALATRLIGTPFVILGNESARLPVLAYLPGVIVVDVGLPPEVLPIMRIHALSLIVLLVEGAPLSLEVEHVEVCVLDHLVDEARLQLLGAVGEGAVVSIITFVQVLRVLGAVF